MASIATTTPMYKNKATHGILTSHLRVNFLAVWPVRLPVWLTD